MFKTALKRGLILGLILVLAIVVISLVGGIGIVDLRFLIIVGLLVLILAALMTIIHNRKGDDE